MSSPGMLCCVTVLRTDVSEESSASIIRVTRIGELGRTLKVISNKRNLLRLLVTTNETSSPIFVNLMMEAASYKRDTP
jgi:hypothetical protein